VRRAAARALSRLARRNRVPLDIAKVEAAVRAELAGARLALAALKRLGLPLPETGKPPKTQSELLALSLLEERDGRILQVLTLLEVLLPQVRLDVVAENLRSESAAARGNAIEVLDNALPEPWKRMVMAALDEVKRRSDLVVADPRPPPDLVEALVRSESGEWVAACAARWSHEPKGPLELAKLVPALRGALKADTAPLREAAAVALEAARLPALTEVLGPLLRDPSVSVRRTTSRLLGRPAEAPPPPALTSLLYLPVPPPPPGGVPPAAPPQES
jgi:hypothetical protein